MPVIKISLDEFLEQLSTKNILVLDARSAEAFASGFVPGSFYCGNSSESAYWLSLFHPGTVEACIITDDGNAEEDAWYNAATYRVVEGGFTAYQHAGHAVDMIIEIEADELGMDLPFDENIVLLDVRSQSEFELGHVVEANNVPLQQLTDLAQLGNLSDEANLYVYSGHGRRGMVACSWLRLQGYDKLRHVTGGYEAIVQEPRLQKEASKSKMN